MALGKEGKRYCLGTNQTGEAGAPSGLRVREKNLGRFVHALIVQAVKSSNKKFALSDLQDAVKVAL